MIITLKDLHEISQVFDDGLVIFVSNHRLVLMLYFAIFPIIKLHHFTPLEIKTTIPKHSIGKWMLK
jgi:hypothetical protein